MNKRTFITSALTLTGLSGLRNLVSVPARAADAGAQKNEFYELRVYSLQSERQKKLVDDFWSGAAIPAYNRAGVKPVGVFTE
ncbi:MAG: NIPSNAP family containing protein, partial [Verrucomicrobiaceae bacterium]